MAEPPATGPRGVLGRPGWASRGVARTPCLEADNTGHLSQLKHRVDAPLVVRLALDDLASQHIGGPAVGRRTEEPVGVGAVPGDKPPAAIPEVLRRSSQPCGVSSGRRVLGLPRRRCSRAVRDDDPLASWPKGKPLPVKLIEYEAVWVLVLSCRAWRTGVFRGRPTGCRPAAAC